MRLPGTQHGPENKPCESMSQILKLRMFRSYLLTYLLTYSMEQGPS